MKKEFELLAPAGSYEIFRAVIEAGADAVYVGGMRFGARAYANNFTEEELLQAIDYAHLRGRSVYLTVNTLIKNAEWKEQLIQYLKPFYERGLDAVLVQDFGALSVIHEYFPDLPIHTSTQMTVTGIEGVRFLQSYGVTRVVMAREMNLAEMKRIHEETGMQLEAFVHGALCYCYSGQCLFSSMLGGRSGNRGRCAQPCRLPYGVLNEKKQEIKSDSYILSLKDLCGIEHLQELHEAGVFSLKIEGRMKQISYAAGVVSYYRKYIDAYLEELSHSDSPDQTKWEVSRQDLQEIADLGNRCGFTDRYYEAHNGKEMVTFRKPNFVSAEGSSREKAHNPWERVKSQIPITGEAVFCLGQPAKLVVRARGRALEGADSSEPDHEVEVEVTGQIVDAARKAPVTEADFRERLNKTGDCPFYFEKLHVQADENVFLPNGAINQLRREALEGLQEAILEPWRRKNCVEKEPDTVMVFPGDEPGEVRMSALVSAVEQLEPVLASEGISAVYLESTMFEVQAFVQSYSDVLQKVHRCGKKAFLALPVIFRQHTAERFDTYVSKLRTAEPDGWLVRNYEELEWVRRRFPGAVIITDHNLYTYNDAAVQAFLKAGAARVTVPLELNRNELAHRMNAGSEMIVYGFYPLMVSAQCVHRNAVQCDKKECITYLKDRYQKLFPVRNFCSECYNIVFNSLPTNLLGQIEEIGKMGIRHLRMNFTIETPQQVRQILDQHMQGAHAQYTNGHYKRGVE